MGVQFEVRGYGITLRSGQTKEEADRFIEEHNSRSIIRSIIKAFSLPAKFFKPHEPTHRESIRDRLRDRSNFK